MSESFGPGGLTIVSKKLVEFPALCAQCGEATKKKEDVTIKFQHSAASQVVTALLFLVPFRDILLLAWEARDGAKTTKIPLCKTCKRPRTLATLKGFSFLLPLFAFLFLLNYETRGFSDWGIVLFAILALLSLIRALFIFAGTEKLLPVKIIRDKQGYHYHFHTGVYQALAAQEGFHHADLTRALTTQPPQRPAPDLRKLQTTPWPPL